jgi:chromosome partitioning protein
MAVVIAVINSKGGVGKTTIATNLAAAYHAAGRSVVLVDGDPQGSAGDWASASETQPVRVVTLDRPTLDRDLAALDADRIIIDGAPQADRLTAAAIRAADLVLIPVAPSPFDIWGFQATADAVRARQEITDGRPIARAVVSRAVANTVLSREVADALEDLGIESLTARTHQRVIYPGSASEGQSVFDAEPNGPAAAEINAIMNELESLL